MEYSKKMFISLLAIVFCTLSFGQPTMKLDSALIKGRIRAPYVDRYEYYPDYSLKSDLSERTAFDVNGRVTRVVQKYKRNVKLPEVNVVIDTSEVSSEPKQVKRVQRVKTEIVAGYETILRYDERGNLIELSDSIYPDMAEELRYINFRHFLYSFDENNRMISDTKMEHRNGRTSGFRFTYEYHSNRLVKRHQFVYTRARAWKGDRIIDNPDPWKWVSTDLCDERGNIVFYRDYNSGDTIRYEYGESDRMTKRERYRNGLVFEKTEFIYDSFGNPVQLYHSNPTFGTKNIENVTTSIIIYDLTKKADEAAGINDSDFCKRLEALKSFYDEAIDYYPNFTNLPVKIMESWNGMPFEFVNDVDLYYSVIEKNIF